MRSTDRKEGQRREEEKKPDMNRQKRRAGERGERKELRYLIFVNICDELKCGDKRRDILEKKKNT